MIEIDSETVKIVREACIKASEAIKKFSLYDVRNQLQMMKIKISLKMVRSALFVLQSNNEVRMNERYEIEMVNLKVFSEDEKDG